MKKLTLLAMFIIASCSVFAQYDDDKTFHFGINGGVSLPLGDLKETTSYGVGIDLQPSFLLSEQIEAYIHAGLHVFQGKSEWGGEAASVLHIPVLAGARFYVLGGFFAGAAVGYGRYSGGDASLGGLCYKPAIGYGANNYDISLQYSSTQASGNTFSFVGLSVCRKF